MCRNRTFRFVIFDHLNVRYAPGSGHYASIDLNYRFVPEADIVLIANQQILFASYLPICWVIDS